ncbi:CBS domain-containing protein [Streptomyces sp. NPDC049577]|uniref:restriction system modified-DNA reader domain-containing protein n=1 Tax=Streptomyces sp. NPDC049577 TaxID=3155153 RepID=UPI00344AE237
MTDLASGNTGPAEPERRNSYLLAGRRVGISDLVQAGLLLPGTRLTFARPRVGETHTARVTDDHLMELADGQRFQSPSRAAAVAVGRGSFDGWHAWALPDGTMLDSLRQQLLDTVTTEESEESEEDSVLSPAARHEWLKSAWRQAQQGSPVTLTVRELLGRWGAARRGYRISWEIATDLINHSLFTSPDFDAVGLDAEVRLISAPADTTDDGGQEAGKAVPAPVPAVVHDDDDDDDPAAGLTVGNLPSALAGVVAVSPTATFEEAITRMAINDYSQLPVLAGKHNLRGAVTWESITRARHADPGAPFSKAIVRAHDVPYDHHLTDVLPLLAGVGFVLVTDQNRAVAGIVTAHDVATAYGEMATPFFLIGEFDQRLRRILAGAFELDYVADVCAVDGKRRITSFDDLSMGDYQRLLERKEAWDTLGWPLDRKVFVARVDELRKARNDLMHFNPDPLPEGTVHKIRQMIALLREYGS